MGILNVTLLSILESLETQTDPMIHKLIISLFGKMIYCWAEGSVPINTDPKGLVGIPKNPKKDTLKRNPLPGFDSFIYERIIVAAMNLPIKPNYPITDGQSQLVLSELANLHKTAYTILGKPYCDFLVDKYFPSLPIPPQVGFEFANAVAQSDKKQLKKFLQVSFS
jgi:exportin-T